MSEINMDVVCQAVVNNCPEDTLECVVARIDETTMELWYWGSYDNYPQAQEIAKFLGGIVVRRMKS